MKNKIQILLFALLISAVGCEDFLQVEDVGQTSIPTYFSDMDGVRAALPGTYSAVYEYYDGDFLMYPDVTGDMLEMNATSDGVQMFLQYNYISTPEDEQTAVGQIWTYAYEALANVNNILEYIPALKKEFPQHEQELESFRAEALFLRALIHFDLVRVYAQPYNFTDDASHNGIPVLLETPGANDHPSRSTVAKTYEQIIDDLLTAEQIFQEFPKYDKYRATQEAAQGLLSRVYLYMEDWEKAVEYADKVIAKMDLSRGQDYIDMYRTADLGDEAIFRLNSYQKNSTLADFYTPQGPVGYVSPKLESTFDDTSDLRYDLLQTGSVSNQLSTVKYSQPSIDEGEKQIDPFVLRLSELYLNRAEANLNLNNLAEAADDIKTIQARALQTDETQITLPENDQDSLAQILEEERVKELSFEGHRLFDLTRNKQSLERYSNTTSSVQSISYPDDRLIMPIPQTEVDANDNMKQNPGY